MPGAPYLHEVGVLRVSHRDHGVHLLDELLLLVVIELHVPLGQARLASPVLDEDEANLQREQAGLRASHPTLPTTSTTIPRDAAAQIRGGSQAPGRVVPLLPLMSAGREPSCSKLEPPM